MSQVRRMFDRTVTSWISYSDKQNMAHHGVFFPAAALPVFDAFYLEFCSELHWKSRNILQRCFHFTSSLWRNGPPFFFFAWNMHQWVRITMFTWKGRANQSDCTSTYFASRPQVQKLIFEGSITMVFWYSTEMRSQIIFLMRDRFFWFFMTSSTIVCLNCSMLEGSFPPEKVGSEMDT